MLVVQNSYLRHTVFCEKNKNNSYDKLTDIHVY